MIPVIGETLDSTPALASKHGNGRGNKFVEGGNGVKYLWVYICPVTLDPSDKLSRMDYECWFEAVNANGPC